MSIVNPTQLAFARQLIRIGLKKYDEHPTHRSPSAVMLLMNSLRIARALLGDSKVEAIVHQVLAERRISAIEGVDA